MNIKCKKLLFLILSLSIILLIIFGCVFFNTKYSAIYFCTSQDSQINFKSKDVITVNSFEKLKVSIDKLNYHVGIIIDKDVLNSKELHELNYWLKTKKEYPIVVLGYSNPSYVYFKKLQIADEKFAPPFSEAEYENFSKEKGYSLAYISNNGEIDGKDFKCDKIDTDDVLKLINDILKNKKIN